MLIPVIRTFPEEIRYNNSRRMQKFAAKSKPVIIIVKAVIPTVDLASCRGFFKLPPPHTNNKELNNE